MEWFATADTRCALLPQADPYDIVATYEDIAHTLAPLSGVTYAPSRYGWLLAWERRWIGVWLARSAWEVLVIHTPHAESEATAWSRSYDARQAASELFDLVVDRWRGSDLDPGSQGGPAFVAAEVRRFLDDGGEMVRP